jgi:hypothetical protein
VGLLLLFGGASAGGGGGGGGGSVLAPEIDHYFLTSSGGSVYDLGTWTRADPGPNFGESDMWQAMYAENAAVDGGLLAFEHSGPRKMSFPLLLGSHASWGGMDGLAVRLRNAARPGGATLDIKPYGVPTGDAVRFDILTGRLRDEYNIRIRPHARELATLELDTQPFGYLPTEILLASVASMGLPGSLAVPGGSVMGDVAGVAQVRVQVGVATNFFGSGANASYQPDVLGYSLAGRASMSAFLSPASLTTPVLDSAAATLAGEAFAPASQVYRVLMGPTSYGGSWFVLGAFPVGTAIESAYRGRHQLYAWVRAHGATAFPYQVVGDVGGGANAGVTFPMGSAGPVASLAPMKASGPPVGAYGAVPGSAMSLLSLGEVTLPQGGSGLSQRTNVRIWARAATSNLGAATPILDIGGLYLLPVDGAHGVMPRGLTVPSVGAGVSVERPAGFVADTAGRVYLTENGVASSPVADALQHFRGGQPKVGATTLRLDVFAAGHPVASGASENPMLHCGQMYAQAAVYYRPRFVFIKGI